ncbi:MAG: hypothetical protein WBI04_10355 [Trichlorobacter sp.]|jgi:uncharacterized membrane protein
MTVRIVFLQNNHGYTYLLVLLAVMLMGIMQSVSAFEIVLVGYGSRIAAVGKITIQIVAECLLQFRIRPVVDAHELESAGQAFGKTLLNLKSA